jgi:acyltransferase
MKPHYDYLDRAKGFGIVLVILGHSTLISDLFLRWISSFHMPLFFMISGILSYYHWELKKPLKEAVLIKVKQLLVPYCVCSLLYMCLRQELSLRKEGIWNLELLNTDLKDTISFMGISVLWFLSTLFFASLIFLIGKEVQKKAGNYLWSFWVLDLLFAGSLMTLIMLEANIQKESGWLFVGRILLGFLYLYLGFRLMSFWQGFANLKRYQFNIKIKNLQVFIGCLVLFLVYLLGRNSATIDMHFMIYENLFVMLVLAILGGLGILFIASGLDLNWINKWSGYLGRNSLFIMVTHLDIKVISVSLTISGTLASSFIPENKMFRFSLFLLCVFAIQVGIIWLFRKIKIKIQSVVRT